MADAILEQFYKLSDTARAEVARCMVEAIERAVAEADRHAAEEQHTSAFDMIGYCRRFHPEYRSTADIMKELREEEEA